MAYYASYDPNLSPSPVTGYYDTADVFYAILPATLFTMSAQQWAARLNGQWAIASGAFVPYVPPTVAPTLAQQAMAALNNGLSITSTGPTLVMTSVQFPVDPVTTAKISAVVTTVSATSMFPGGSSTFPMKNSAGSWVTMTVPQYLAVAGAISSYVAALNLIADGNPLNATELPSNSVTIFV